MTSLRVGSRGGDDDGLALLALPALPKLQHFYLRDYHCSGRASVEAAVRSRTLQALSLRRFARTAEENAAIAAPTRVLPVMLDVRLLTGGHSDVRPLCFHPRRSALQSLSFTLGNDPDAILTSIADGLPGLRELRLELAGGRPELWAWPPTLHLQRLSLCFVGGSREVVHPDQLLSSLGESPSMRQNLRSLMFSGELPEALGDTTIVALGRLRRLSYSKWTIRFHPEDVQWRRSEAAMRSTICGRLRIHLSTRSRILNG